MTGGSQLMTKARMILATNIQEHMLLDFASKTEAIASQQEGMPLEEAAKQLVQMNIQKMQQEQDNGKDEAAMLIAQAEMLDTQIEKEKLDFDKQFRFAELELKKEVLDLDKMKQLLKAEEVSKKIQGDIDKIVTTKSLDAMIKGFEVK
jgi:hypothetical protein